MLVARNAMGSAFGKMMHILKELAHFRAPYRSQPDLDISSPQALTMPHGVAIGVGAALLLILRP